MPLNAITYMCMHIAAIYGVSHNYYALLSIESCMHHVLMVFVVMCISSIGMLIYSISTQYIHTPSTPCMYMHPVYCTPSP